MQRARRRGLGRITPGAWTVAGIGLLVLLTTAAYLPSLNGEFLVDDDVLLTNSPLIAAPNGVSRFWFTAEAVDYWPVSNTSLWLEWRLWKMNATGYRLTNLVLHVIAALLLWSILQSLSVPGAFFAALLFALHPVNVQSVAWITQRKSLLAMVFALLCVLWHRQSEARSARHAAGRSATPGTGSPWLRSRWRC